MVGDKPGDISQRLAAEQTRLLYAQVPAAVLATVLISLGVLAALADQIPRRVLAGWFATLLFCSILRLVLMSKYRRANPADSDADLWQRLFIGFMSATYLPWSLGMTYFAAQTALPYQTFLALVQCGVVAAALSTQAFSPASYAIFALIMITPMALLLSVQGGELHRMIALLSILYLVYLLRASKGLSDRIKGMMELVIKNELLANTLSAQKERAETMNHTLQLEVEERRRIEEVLYEEKERALVTLASIGDGVITTDLEGCVEYLNAVAETHTGWNLAQARGRSLSEVLVLIDESTGERIRYAERYFMTEHHNQWRPGQVLLQCRNADRRFSIELSASPIRDRNDFMMGCVIVFHDVTELRTMAREMAYLASHDALTGLINRREFEIRLDQALMSARNEHLSHVIFYMDLDQFKVVNDTCGHFAGDELLKNVSCVIKSATRSSDIVARLGGDEFAVLLEGCNLENARAIAEEILQAIKNFRFSYGDHVFSIGVSIGGVPITCDSGTLADVLGKADSACYVAKEAGRNRIHISSPMDSEIARRQGEMRWVHRINHALRENSFVLYGQQLGCLKAGNQQGYVEVLLRMRNEDGGVVLPRAFIPAAERYQVMPAIDRWVITHTLELLAAHAARFKGREIFAINLSGASLGDDGFQQFVIDQLELCGIAPRHICFEITETVAISNFLQANRFVCELKQMGCHLALDDFGSGLSSFAYLKSLPVDFLKIYGGFVKNLSCDVLDSAMVQAINDIGHVMGKQTVAEYVENLDVCEQLASLGVDFGQGYVIHRPKPLSDVLVELS